MAQATTTTEQAITGKATGAACERTQNGWAYDVEVLNGAKLFDVRIDAHKAR